MKYTAQTPEDYIEQLPEERKFAISELRRVIQENLSPEFVEVISYGMIGYAIPHSIYPKGYHCDPTSPLPFMGIASQKNFISVYHMGVYADPDLMEWFTNEYPKHCKTKLDMGKSCIRLKKMEHIPFKLIGELTSKINAENWIRLYEEKLVR